MLKAKSLGMSSNDLCLFGEFAVSMAHDFKDIQPFLMHLWGVDRLQFRLKLPNQLVHNMFETLVADFPARPKLKIVINIMNTDIHPDMCIIYGSAVCIFFT